VSDLYRFGISLDRELIEAFDRHIDALGYQSRSEALRDLIREELLRKTQADGGMVAGAIVMTYDHHKRELVNRLLDIQHDFHDLIISTQHIHLDHGNCLEVIAAKGNSPEIEKLSSALKVLVGVKHLSLSVTATR
jgi:CopG family nickel-responsive transcriptional regulator